MNNRSRGFTLVELVVVMVVMGILAGILVVFLGPAMQNYFDTSRRAGLTDVADGAMRKFSRDVRVSVPNSVRILPIAAADQMHVGGSQCIEMVPTSSGGRFRTAPDINNVQSRAIEPGQQFTEFDVMTDVNAAVNDWIVIGNQNPTDVYAGVNSARIAANDPPPAAGLGTRRIRLAGTGMQAPAGYDVARFVVVPAAQGPVTYYCRDAGVDANGNGTGTLFRAAGYGFADPRTCPVGANNLAVTATRVAACNFRYDPNPGATQESGYVEVDLTLQEANEPVRLQFGVRVDNLP